ncbi:MAG: hypothetical protein HKN17_10205 [Rhodothermales bacterium]|nr:hypothetical protein [Rhodothermales bacterium]
MTSSMGAAGPLRFLSSARVAAMFLTAAALWSTGVSTDGHVVARQSPIVFAPLEWSVQGAWATEVDQARFTFGAKRAVPVFTLLPQTTPGSRIDAVRLRAGIRSDDSGVDPRLRITAFDLDVQKRYKAAVVTMIDVDMSGLRDIAATWLGAGYGPGFAVQRFNRSFEIRTQAHISLQTVEFGRTSFPGLTKEAARRRTTLEYGARAFLLARPTERLSVVASGRYSAWISEADPVWVAGRAGLMIHPTPSISIEAFGGIQSVEGDSSDDSRTELGLAIRYTKRESLY